MPEHIPVIHDQGNYMGKVPWVFDIPKGRFGIFVRAQLKLRDRKEVREVLEID